MQNNNKNHNNNVKVLDIYFVKDLYITNRGWVKMDEQKIIKRLIFNTIADLVSDFLYYDRKDDELLPMGKIERFLKADLITEEEIIACFKKNLLRNIQ